ncbi:hypothetical protein GY45DRAFT_1259762 [Cubamyces sp. BRFM 1775]|nr:hypothetical protein GY45DRAFT_1259762 [Cubamyces sp. BRFM 1775]
MDVDSEDGRPSWIVDAVKYFELIEGGEHWSQLVSEWQELEKALGYPDRQNRIPAKLRPEEIRVWCRNSRDYEKLPKIKSAKQYGTVWRQWWEALQPTSRGEKTWPLPRIQPPNASEWDLVRRGGCNGFFLVIMGLAWWLLAALNGKEGAEDALEAVEDVSWVCRTLLKVCTNASPTEKHPAADLGSASNKCLRLS